ncbi:MAG TPA: Glu-tRNA(Gln) amidotransferase subunit GatD [Nanoarchaeota archaeon]|nr:Glu-tRNA(Gln) amidotransferase subunit GatD [Nanoarchaeota archaeon]
MYSEKINNILKKLGIEIGDKIIVEKNGKEYKGILMPRTFYNPEILVLKLENGYNIGIAWDENIKIKLVSKFEKPCKKPEEKAECKNENAISILLTGGTIASKVDYRTGGVTPIMDANELIGAIPEIKDISEIKSRVIMQVFSENMNFDCYEKMIKEIEKEIKQGCEGIIIAHGTDTMHYSSAAISFAFQNLGIPLIFVGAQRSSDRGSSDAAINLISACIFAKHSNVSGVFVCMHESISDYTCAIHLGTRVRKLHTSRRDAFKTVNAKPVARVFWREKKIEWIEKDCVKEKNKERELKIYPKFERKVALIKIHPGFNPELIEFLLEKGYKGIVLEGTGLGHAPDYTFDAIKQACEQAIVCMTSQCIFGRINMKVYSTGRDLLKFGVIPCEMLPEVAFIKLSWALGNFTEQEAKEIMQKNIAGEIVERIL